MWFSIVWGCRIIWVKNSRKRNGSKETTAGNGVGLSATHVKQ